MMSDDARAIAAKAIGNVEANVGDNVIGIGLDDYCLPCITFVTIIEHNADGTYTIQTREQNPIKILVRSIDGYFHDTFKNREIVRSACKQVCDKHFSAIKTQLGNIG